MSKLKLKNSELPTYTMTLPVSKITAKYRPFVVREEKVLLIALQSKDQQQIADAMHQIISVCTNDIVDTTKLCSADSEYAFLQIRAKSIGEEVKPTITCNHCGTQTNLKVRLDQFNLYTDYKPTDNNIKLYDNISVVMRHPTLHDFGLKGNAVDVVFEITKKCIDSMVVDEEVYTRNEIDEKELSDFVDNLTPNEFLKLTQFFENTPKLNYELKYNCVKCSETVKVEFKNITDFF